MMMKRKHIFILTLMSCDIAFSQHPYSHGNGGALYWGLVGLLAYGLWSLVLHIIPIIWSYIKKMFVNNTKTHNLIELPETMDSNASGVNAINVYQPIAEEIIVLDDTEKSSDSITNNMDQNINETCSRVDRGTPRFCHHCGAKIDYESGKFCKYCGNELV